MDDTTSSHPIDDFDAAWQIVGRLYQPAIQVTSALIKLSGAGERPVEVERLATASGRLVDETLALARQFLKVNVQDGLVHLDLSAAGTSARYRLQIGARTTIRAAAHRTSFGRRCLPARPFMRRQPARRPGARFASSWARRLSEVLRRRWPDADVDLSAYDPYTPRR